jgi:two-component system, NarL family, response regulator NreC
MPPPRAKPTGRMTRVILLDDHQLFLDSLSFALQQVAGFTVAGVTTARQLYTLLETAKPDLIVLDLLLDDTDGISVLWELRRRRVAAPTLVLTMLDSRTFVHDAFAAGATGYALKRQPLSDLLVALTDVAARTPYLPPSLGSIPEIVPSHTPQEEQPFAQLSRREREVCGRILAGASSRSIARDLAISLKTVETHRTHINRKLEIRSAAELIRIAALKGLLPGTSARPSAPT